MTLNEDVDMAKVIRAERKRFGDHDRITIYYDNHVKKFNLPCRVEDLKDEKWRDNLLKLLATKK